MEQHLVCRSCKKKILITTTKKFVKCGKYGLHTRSFDLEYAVTCCVTYMVDDSEVSNRCYTDVVRKILSWSDKTILNPTEEDIEISFLGLEEEISIVVKDGTIQDVPENRK